MKKLRIRVIAWLMTLLLAGSSFNGTLVLASDVVGTTVAEKVNPLEVTEEEIASGRVLYVTAEMVSENGTLLISDGNWERIIIAKEVAAKKITLQGVIATELVVESGTECIVEMKSGKIGTVALVPPELEEVGYAEIVKMLASGMSANEVANIYREYCETKASLEKTVPTIVTRADAEVSVMKVSGNAELNLAGGNVAKVEVTSEESQYRLEVDIVGYDGNVAVVQAERTDGLFSIVNVSLKNSNLEALQVTGNQKSVCSVEGDRRSSVTAMNVAGASSVTMNVKATEVKVTKDAEEASVRIYSEVENVVVEADNSRVSLASSAKVGNAVVEADNVKVSSSGTIANSEISGSGSTVTRVPASTGGSTSSSKPSSKPSSTVTPTPEPEQPEEETPTVPTGTQVSGIFTYTVDAVMKLATITGVTEEAREEINAGTITAIHVPMHVDGWQVVEIGNRAFSNLKATELTLPNGLLFIGEGAFTWMEELTTITIPASVENIGSGPFAMARSLTEIIVEEGNKYFCSEDGVLFGINKKNLIQAPAGKDFGVYEIPETVTVIGKFAFQGCNMYEIIIPNGVIDIQYGAFAMLNLRDMYIPESVRKIDLEAFRYTMMNTFEIDEANVNYASKDGVWYNKEMTQLYGLVATYGIEEFEVPNTVTRIHSGAFFSLSDLKRVIIPSSVKYIDDNAFVYITPTLVVEEGSAADKFAQKKGFEVEYIGGDSTGTATGSALTFRIK